MGSILSSVLPGNPTFGEVTGLTASTEPGSYVYSQVRYTTGYGEGESIVVISGLGEYRINKGDWTSSNGTFNNGDFIFARTQIPTESNKTMTTTYNLGGDTDTFIVSTGTGSIEEDGNNSFPYTFPFTLE